MLFPLSFGRGLWGCHAYTLRNQLLFILRKQFGAYQLQILVSYKAQMPSG